MRPLVAVFSAFAALAVSACMTDAKIVSSSETAPTIAQAQAEPYNGPKQRIAIEPFEYRAQQGGGGVSQGMADMLTDSLFNTNKFIVVERDRLGAITAEQDLADTGRFKQDTMAPKGELEGAQLLIRGSITQFEPKCAGGSIILASTSEACIAINLRIVDVKTGRVVNATTVEATSANNGVGLLFTRSALPIGLGAYRNTPMEKAIRQAIELAVQHIAKTKV
jgi:curli biogenesis system outer membrane secretion channel CsgG